MALMRLLPKLSSHKVPELSNPSSHKRVNPNENHHKKTNDDYLLKTVDRQPLIELKSLEYFEAKMMGLCSYSGPYENPLQRKK